MIYVYQAKTENILMTIERLGCECGCGCPQKCLGSGCPICCDFCKDGVTVYEGYVEGRPGELVNPPPPIMGIKQPTCGGKMGLFPQLFFYPGANFGAPPTEVIQGPCIFGGCYELCCKASYKHDTTDGQPISEIVHLTPKQFRMLSQRYAQIRIRCR